MSKIIDAIFPMYANYRDNRLLRRKLDTKEGNELESLEHAKSIDTDTLKQQYHDTFHMKDKLEDKAKINVIGITIAITIMMGASGVLKSIYEKYPISVLQWIAFVFLTVATMYLLIAGIIVLKVLTDENIVYIVSSNSSISDKTTLHLDYYKCIAQNNILNLIRNNSVYSAYECIRNALLCLFIILLFSTIPIEFQQNKTAIISMHDQYRFTFAPETISYLKSYDVQSFVEYRILTAVKNDIKLRNSNNSIGIIDSRYNLFIKFKISKGTITVITIEPYSTP